MQVIVPYRGDHYDVLRLRLVGDLGQVLFFPYELRDEESVRKVSGRIRILLIKSGSFDLTILFISK